MLRTDVPFKKLRGFFFVPRRLARKEKTPLERGFAYDAV